MEKFELWIDESGDFLNDEEKIKQGKTASCVGGVLVKEGILGENKLRNWIPEEMHCCESTDTKKQMQYIEEMQKLDGLKYVLLVNEETVSFFDDRDTYFFMLAEMIVQVLKKLKSENREIHLKITIATRVKGNLNQTHKEFIEGQQEIDIKKLEEHLALARYRDGNIVRKEWSIIADKARDNVKLQVADIVCNTYFTRDTKMKEYSDKLREYFSDEKKTWKFTLSQDRYTSFFVDMLSKGELGAAVLGLCKSKTENNIKKGMHSVEKRLAVYPIELLKWQLQYISIMLQYYVNQDDGHGIFQEEYILLLNNLKHYFLPILEQANTKSIKELAAEFAFDMEFYLLTVYTHMGNLNEESEQITKCDLMVEKLLPTWNNTDKKIKYKNRKLIHQINCFDFENAYGVFKKERERLKEIQEWMSSVNDDSVKYEEYAKLLGTGAQILQLQIRGDKSKYEEARRISGEAIDTFKDSLSQKRQYQYRIMIETDIGNYSEAILFLKKSLGLQKDVASKQLLSTLKDRFDWMHMIRLIAEGMIADRKEARGLFELITKEKGIFEIADKENKNHPYEIIMWKLGTCYAVSNQLNAAQNYYDKSIQFCFAKSNFTLWIIGMTVLLEKYAYVLKNDDKKTKDIKKDIQKYMKKIDNASMPDNMKEIFKDVDLERTEWEYFFVQSRKVTY